MFEFLYAYFTNYHDAGRQGSMARTLPPSVFLDPHHHVVCVRQKIDLEKCYDSKVPSHSR